jgi:hypothetical protein
VIISLGNGDFGKNTAGLDLAVLVLPALLLAAERRIFCCS